MASQGGAVNGIARGWLLAGIALKTMTAFAADPASSNVAEVTVWGSESVPATSSPVEDQGSPQSRVDHDTIRLLTAPMDDFATAANFTPSYVSSAPNGAGFDAAKNQTLRGFVDGQFNVTLDGIPFADPDTFTHHSTSYFPTAILDHMVVDRGPGDASQLGYASFGGSVNLFSEGIPDAPAARLYSGYGSFATSLYGATLGTAAPRSSGEAGVVTTVQYTQSSGAMNDSPGDKGDLFLRAETLIGNGRLTAVYAYDRYHFMNPGSITLTDLGLFGPSYGFNSDPASPNYYGYSDTWRSSDFEYLRFEENLGGWLLRETLYGYSYRNTGLSLKGDQTASPIGMGFAGIDPDDIAGRQTQEDYRVTGNDFRLKHRDPIGTLLVGVWAEHSWQTEDRLGVDLSTGELYDANKKAQSPVYFDFDAHLDNIEPYLEYSVRPIEAWNVELGVRYQHVTRDFDASVIQNFLPGTDGTIARTTVSWLPSFDTTYRLADHTNVYAQISRGALVPSQAFFYTANPASGNRADPESATVSQLGLVHRMGRYAFGVDVYNANFDNYVSTVVQGGETLFTNSGGIRYRGVETEGHLEVGAGLTLVANASLLRATFQDSEVTSPIQQVGDTIPFAPAYTGLAGFLYGDGPWAASLISKFVGREYQGKNGSADGATFRVNAYSFTNATLTRGFNSLGGINRLRVTFAVNNLWNSDAITDNAGPAIAGNTNLVNVLPRRNFMLSVFVDP